MPSTTIRITNATANILSLSGDEGKPDIRISKTGGSNYSDVYVRDIIGNELFCDTLSDWITSGYVVVTRGTVTLTAAQVLTFKTGMTEDVYDSDDDGLSDRAEQLNFTSATTVTNAMTAYTVLSTDTFLDVNVTAGVVELLLPAVASTNDGRVIDVFDLVGLSGTSNITITPDGTDTINGVNAAITITKAYGRVALRSDGSGGWLTDMAQVALLETAIGTSAEGRATIAIDLKAVAETNAAVSGLVTQDFVPTKMFVHVTAVGGAALNGDAEVTIGTTTPGGTEILGVTALTGLIALNAMYVIDLTGLFPAIAGNATLYANVTTADTSGGTGTANVVIVGQLL